jgi:phosphate transport system substrate-binding protein
MKTSLLSVVVTILSLASIVTGRADVSITGGGSSFDQPAFAKWFDAYRKVDSSVSFNYQPNGSGFGQTSLLNQTIDFGASDFTLPDDKLAQSQNGPILQLPIVAGAVVVSYNLPESPKLKLDGDIIAGIFLGKITKWNDGKIAALNPDVKLPELDIAVAHRTDSSGTTYIFSDYLSSVSKDWESKMGRHASLKWAAATLGGKGNAGVAGQIKQIPGAVGYIELAYAVQNKLPYADLKNQSGKYVEATPESVSAALKTAKIPDDFRFSLVNAPGDDAYPIAGPSWVLVYQNQKDTSKGKALEDFLKWAVTDGQKISPTLDYAPLPSELQQRIVSKIEMMK